MVRNEAVRLVLDVVLLALAFWWGWREGSGADITRLEGGKDG